ncbi:VanZ family protein [Janibacter melonis]|uniref:VanZ family protein n=1 Tax=Janibacter TaxID=53457 RepID=UPI0020445E11|nr:VanZ family protein [Janibacter melonis]MCM3554160.1 VanZ family protein [Janibacter melonis]
MSTSTTGRPVQTGRRPLAVVLTGVAVLVQLVVLYDPSPAGGGDIPFADKVVHALVFGMPVALAGWAGLRWVWVAAVVAVHAPVSEIVQGLALPARSGDPFDVVADLVGVVLGALVARRLSRVSGAPSRRW